MPADTPRALRALRADDVDLRVHHPAVERDVVFLLLEAPDLRPQRVVVRNSRGRGGRRVLLRRNVTGARVDRALERVGGVASKLPAATCPLRRSVRSARRMSILPCSTRRRREIESSPSSSCPSRADSSSSESSSRSGSMSTGAFRVVGPLKSMLQRSEGFNLSLRLWRPAEDFAPKPPLPAQARRSVSRVRGFCEGYRSGCSRQGSRASLLRDFRDGCTRASEYDVLQQERRQVS